MYITFPCMAILLAIICAFAFHIWLPFWLVGTIALLGPLVSSIMRFRLWVNRYELLSEEDMNSHQASIVFAAIPLEIVFWIIAMGFLLSENC